MLRPDALYDRRQSALAEKMTNDIDEMEKMLSDYLQYAKSQAEENSTKINLSNMITEILKNYDKNRCEFEKSEITKQIKDAFPDANLVEIEEVKEND